MMNFPSDGVLSELFSNANRQLEVWRSFREGMGGGCRLTAGRGRCNFLLIRVFRSPVWIDYFGERPNGQTLTFFEFHNQPGAFRFRIHIQVNRHRTKGFCFMKKQFCTLNFCNQLSKNCAGGLCFLLRLLYCFATAKLDLRLEPNMKVEQAWAALKAHVAKN